ncbi:hypothetical protein BDW22DRAFT_1409769 [Trametopsis cervina]|nr:hypothetical protein BDW22DRAFT_1409769 [Trametopsis cervina]
MSVRKLNGLEQKIHQAALASHDKTLSQKEIDALVSDQTQRMGALNFLLGAGLLKPLQHGSGGKLSFRAVVKQELEIKKDLSAEENIVLSHIQASGNDGIWTKHLKVKTELHQTVIDRCLKSLTQKQLVKALKGSVQVRHPTRKIYMLFHLEPSVEMTGGPWYTDKELDTEFIKLLSAACLKFIRDRSFPRATKSKTRAEEEGAQQRMLYSISGAPAYPTAAQVQTFLNKSRITETQLTVDHVEMLLNVLVIDGDVERIPALGAALWESSLGNDEGSDAESSDGTRKSSRSKKRKRAAGESRSRKGKRKRAESSDDESDSGEDSKRRKKSKPKSRSKSKKHAKAESGSEDERSKKRRHRAGSDESDGSETQGSDDESAKKKKSKAKKRRRVRDSSDSSSASEDEDEDEDRSAPPRRSRHAHDSSPAMDDDVGLLNSGANVYRAVHAERMLAFGLGQAPCGRCPAFAFCKDGGPVNPGECVYYGDWLEAAEEVKVV